MKGFFGKMFQKEPSLEEMIKAAESYKQRTIELVASNAAKSWDFPVYRNDRWMIEYCFSIPADMEDAFRNGKNTFTFYVADITDYDDPWGDSIPRPLLVFKFDDDPDRSLVMFANQSGGIGKPDGTLQSLDYFKILQQQPTIPVILISSGIIQEEIENPTRESSLFFMVRNHMNEFFDKPGSHDVYRDRTGLTLMEIERAAREQGVSAGRYCLDRYKAKFLDLEL